MNHENEEGEGHNNTELRDTTPQAVVWMFCSLALQSKIDVRMLEEVDAKITKEVESLKQLTIYDGINWTIDFIKISLPTRERNFSF